MQSSSTRNLRVRSTGGKLQNQSSSPKKKFDHKKQIQATLNELHRLQAQIYSLNVPQNPHSCGPIKKQIKQLSYLYENMTKPKLKNNLNVKSKDIKGALKTINEGISAIQLTSQKGSPQKNKQAQTNCTKFDLIRNFSQVTYKLQQQEQNQQKIKAKTLKNLMKQMYGIQFDLSIVSQSKTSRITQITSQQLQKFINYNQFDQFDPLQQAFNCLLDQNGKFSFKRYNQLNQIFGMPKVKELEILFQALAIQSKQGITFEVFKKIMVQGQELGIV